MTTLRAPLRAAIKGHDLVGWAEVQLMHLDPRIVRLNINLISKALQIHHNEIDFLCISLHTLMTCKILPVPEFHELLLGLLSANIFHRQIASSVSAGRVYIT